MNISNMFETPGKRQKKEHFNHLIRISMADGIIMQSELAMLHRIGRKMGFTEPEIEELIASGKKPEFDIPYELSKRFEQMYDVVKMILSDGQTDEKEIQLATGMALIYGFSEQEVPSLLELLINGVKTGEDEEELFRAYNRTRISR
jgi:uncharacterized tellurite resistance protein B-like protein